MRFIIGLLIGFGIGLAAALLLAPQKGRLHREGAPEGEEAGRAFVSNNHDAMAGLRRSMQALQEQVQEAWEEARLAAREAEEKMRARYEKSVPRKEK
jgi:gas vesicle protein